MKALAWLLPLVLLQGGDPFEDGVGAYRAGRFVEALAAFTAAEQQAGADAPAELLYDKALAALGAGRPQVAEDAIAQAAARGGPEFAALADFVRGNAAFLRCERAEAVAGLTDPEPGAFATAIAAAEAARKAWQEAAASRDHWPEAARNVERALAKLEDLRRKRDEAERNRKPNPTEPGTPEPLPLPANPPPTGPEEVEPVAQTTPLTPQQVALLLQKLEQKEQEKRRLRESAQRTRTGAERDW